MGQYYFFDMSHPFNFAVLVNDARTNKVYHDASPNSDVSSLLFKRMRLAKIGIQDNLSLSLNCSTPVTLIEDYYERKEEKQYSPQAPRIIHKLVTMIFFNTLQAPNQTFTLYRYSSFYVCFV